MSVQGVVSLLEILRPVAQDLERVEAVLQEQLRSKIPLIAEIGRHIGEAGGKRIRPGLLLLAGRASGYAGERAVRLAAVVELLHTATLLHDDIIDQATVRRGRRSVNGRWGNDLSVLLGDLLFTKSMSLALAQDDVAALRLLSDVTLSMIEGQVLELERCADLGVSAEDQLDIVRHKTAALFSACLRLGAMLGGADAARERALAGYGLDLGIAFQVVDDLLDLVGEQRALGKPVASDLREGKLTLPVVFLLRRAGAPAREAVRTVLDDRGFARVQPREIERLLRECGAYAEALALAEHHAARARAALLPLERSPCRDALLALPEFVLSRER
jgi:octaprenyl-diphosphate synthase